jgi:hypothetical protein
MQRESNTVAITNYSITNYELNAVRKQYGYNYELRVECSEGKHIVINYELQIKNTAEEQAIQLSINRGLFNSGHGNCIGCLPFLRKMPLK